MTISTEPAPLSYNGDDVTVAFAITWKFFAKSDVVATLRNSVGGETVWILATDYTLTDAGVDAGGTLTATTAPATGEKLVLTLEPPNTQDKSLPLGGPFPSPNVEDALDEAAQRDSKMQEVLDRTLRVPKTDSQSGSSLEIPIDSLRASKSFQFDSSGKPLMVEPTDASGTSATAAGSTTSRLLAEHFSDVLHVKDFGAVGDGVTDDVVAIEAAATAAAASGAELISDNSVYFISRPLVLVSNVKWDMGGATIKLAGAQAVLKPVLTVTSLTGLHLRNGTLDGNKANQTASTAGTEDGGLHCLRLAAATDCTFEDMNFTNGYTDGIYIAGTASDSTFSEDIRFIRCDSDANKRQGCSIISAKKILFEETYFQNTSGTSPQAGVDIEPDVAAQIVEDIYFKRCHFLDNGGRGFTGVLKDSQTAKNVVLDECTVSGNTTSEGDDQQVVFSGIDNSEWISSGLNNCRVTGQVAFQASSGTKTKFTDNFVKDGSITGGAFIALRIQDHAADSSFHISGAALSSAQTSTSAGTVFVNNAAVDLTIDSGALITQLNASNSGVYMSTAVGATVRILGTTIDGQRRGVIAVDGGDVFIGGGTLIKDTTVDGCFVSAPNTTTRMIVDGAMLTGNADGIDGSGAFSIVIVGENLYSGNTVNFTENTIGSLVDEVAVGNVGAGDDDLITLSVAANTLAAVGRGLRIVAAGTTANNADAKTVKLKFGTATLLTTALTVSQAGVWRIEAEVIRTGSSAQKYCAQLVQGGAATLLDAEQGTTTETDTADIVVKTSGTATSNDDIICEYLAVSVIH